MKTCPICNAVAFDDQATCYGCLHDFGKDELLGEAPEESVDAQSAPDVVSFVLSLVPHSQASGSFSWTCTVEPV